MSEVFAGNSEFDLSARAAFLRVWMARWFIVFGGGVGLVLAGAFLFFAVPHYKAQMIVAPASPINGAEVSSLLADENLFALRYVMQRFGGSGSSDFLKFENMIHGQNVAALLLQSDAIKEGLFEVQRYRFDAPQNEWRAVELAEYMEEHVRVEPVGATGLRRLVFYHPDSAFAAYFLKMLHGVADGLVRRTIRDDSAGRILYLKEAIAESVNSEHRRVLTTLLMEQERLRMLVSMNQDYAAQVIEPAFSSSKPMRPSRVLILCGFILSGMVLGYAAFSLRRDA